MKNATLKQALQQVSGQTGLVFHRLDDIIAVVPPSEPLKRIPPESNTNLYSFTDYMTYPFDYTRGDPSELGGENSVGAYGERNTYNFNMIREFMANYANSFGRHNIDILYNFSNQQYNAGYSGGTTEYITTLLPYLRNLGGERQYTNVGGDKRRWALQGHLFRIGYNFDYKYYLDATLRRDGSARFAPENRWGAFPSFSVAWRLSREDFMRMLNMRHFILIPQLMAFRNYGDAITK